MGVDFLLQKIHHKLLSLGGVEMQMFNCKPLNEGVHKAPVLLLLLSLTQPTIAEPQTSAGGRNQRGTESPRCTGWKEQFPVEGRQVGRSQEGTEGEGGQQGWRFGGECSSPESSHQIC